MKQITTGLIMLIASALSSCVSTKEVLYFQDAQSSQESIVNQSYQTHIQSDDILSIIVTSSDPLAVQPFNKPAPSGSNVTALDKGYLVDVNGNIIFPMIGTIRAAGLTSTELSASIRKKLIDGNYILEPLVSVAQLNFKYSVLGEVKNPGVYNSTSDRISILDALSRAGDMSIQGNRSRIAIIREIDGKRVINYLDIKSKEMMNSPYFYLAQNDVIYVEPSKRINQNSDRQWVALAFSGSSVLLSMFALLFRK